MSKKELIERIREIIYMEDIVADDKMLDILCLLSSEVLSEPVIKPKTVKPGEVRDPRLNKVLTDIIKDHDLLKHSDRCLIQDFYDKNPDQVGKPVMISCPCSKCNPAKFQKDYVWG